MTSTRSLPVQPADATPKKRLGLSWTQIAAAGFASITATVILSFFSISGTLIGAAVFSMASAVGNAVYGQSLRRTQDVVLDVVPFGGKADPASPTVVIDVVDEGETTADEPPSLPAATPAPAALSRKAWKRIVLFAVVIFAFVMAVVTSVELIAGRPLTDVLRGENGTGTSIGGGGRAPAPTVTVTVTPSVVTTTPTVTQTAPAATTTAPATSTTTVPSSGAATTTAPATPSDSGTGTPSPTPTSGTPSATSSSSP